MTSNVNPDPRGDKQDGKVNTYENDQVIDAPL